ncbi:MAG: hypothetical protein ABIS50_04845 [Luteolibacter sp.]|uniref:hypothetical protein n=1 Tax=Luteolibacter sp. TaxID=1962973 RepID=UPI0032671465
MVIPIGALVASVLILILSLKKGRACMSVAFSLAIGEAILLALFGLGLVLPAMDILYHMGDS